jgi:hypothetical protein
MTILNQRPIRLDVHSETDRLREKAFGIHRRRFLQAGALGIMQLMTPWPALGWMDGDPDPGPNLADLPKLALLDKPLLVFRDYKADPDSEVKAQILRDVAGMPRFLERLKERVNYTKRLRLDVDRLDIQLLYVPEIRSQYANLYRRYCMSAVDFLLDKIGAAGIYGDFVVPTQAHPAIPAAGITVFLVNRLMKAYVAECTFTSDSGASARYRISGKLLSTNMGAVDLEIENPEEGDYQLKRGNYSIWQNSSRHLFTLLQLPLEETLHYIMGVRTDEKIRQQLKTQRPSKVFEVQKLADHWLAVEEALVGGLSILVLKEYAKTHDLPISTKDIEAATAARQGRPQYIYRKNGEELVQRMGLRDALALYRDNPSNFEKELEKA